MASESAFAGGLASVSRRSARARTLLAQHALRARDRRLRSDGSSATFRGHFPVASLANPCHPSSAPSPRPASDVPQAHHDRRRRSPPSGTSIFRRSRRRATCPSSRSARASRCLRLDAERAAPTPRRHRLRPDARHARRRRRLRGAPRACRPRAADRHDQPHHQLPAPPAACAAPRDVPHPEARQAARRGGESTSGRRPAATSIAQATATYAIPPTRS